MKPVERVLNVLGHRTRYLEAAPGEPARAVVFVHGFAGRAEMWAPNLSIIGAKHRAIAPDLLGHGATAKPSEGSYSMDTYADFLLAFLDEADIDSCALVGSSMGGLVAGMAAARQPRRFDALVLADSAGLGRLSPAAQARYVRYFFETALFGPSEERLRKFWEDNIYRDPKKIPRTAIRRGIEVWTNTDSRRSLTKTGRALYLVHKSLLPVLPDIPIRKAFFWGEHDPQFPVAYAKAAQEANPGSELVTFDAGHLPNLEVPEEFNRALLRFLNGAKPSKAVREAEAR